VRGRVQVHAKRAGCVSRVLREAANHELRVLPLVAGGKWDWPRAAPGYLDFVTTWMVERSQPRDR